MIFNRSDKAQAILFVSNEGVIKELLFPEFEAVLDGFVPMEEWAGRTANAVYLELNSEFCATAAVFFTIDFDATGAVERAWNLPLRDLARTSERGPDMGAGPIHLACASHCPVSLFQDYMWDPDLSESSAQLSHIKESLKRNKMGIHFKVEDDAETFDDLPASAAGHMQQLSKELGEQYKKEMRHQMTHLLEEQKKQMTLLSEERDKAVNDVRLEYLQKIEALQAQIANKNGDLQEAHKRNVELKGTIEGQATKLQGLREYFESKLDRAAVVDESLVDTLRAQNTAEIEAKVTAATQELKELLGMRDVELAYRKEHEEALNKELREIRVQHQDLLANAGDKVLETLSSKGVNFVTYQPGAGHITIPVTQIGLFLESPVAFTADYCGVSEAHYNAWLTHFQAPVCMANGIHGDICGENVHRVTTPSEFVDGESNYCSQHNQLQRVEAVKT